MVDPSKARDRGRGQAHRDARLRNAPSRARSAPSVAPGASRPEGAPPREPTSSGPNRSRAGPHGRRPTRTKRSAMNGTRSDGRTIPGRVRRAQQDGAGGPGPARGQARQRGERILVGGGPAQRGGHPDAQRAQGLAHGRALGDLRRQRDAQHRLRRAGEQGDVGPRLRVRLRRAALALARRLAGGAGDSRGGGDAARAP